MDNTKKCDICGVMYERYCNKPTGFVILYERPKFDNDFGMNYFRNCCPDCMSILSRYIKDMRNRKAE